VKENEMEFGIKKRMVKFLKVGQDLSKEKKKQM